MDCTRVNTAYITYFYLIISRMPNPIYSRDRIVRYIPLNMYCTFTQEVVFSTPCHPSINVCVNQNSLPAWVNLWLICDDTIIHTCMIHQPFYVKKRRFSLQVVFQMTGYEYSRCCIASSNEYVIWLWKIGTHKLRWFW